MGTLGEPFKFGRVFPFLKGPFFSGVEWGTLGIFPGLGGQFQINSFGEYGWDLEELI